MVCASLAVVALALGFTAGVLAAPTIAARAERYEQAELPPDAYPKQRPLPRQPYDQDTDDGS